MALARLMVGGFSVAAFGVGAEAMIVNGSLTGPTGAGIVPPAWTTAYGTPDTCDASGPFNNTGFPWTLSPDGGTFVRGLAPPVGTAEAISQVVTGLTIGDTYQVGFFQTHLGFAYPPTPTWYTGTGRWAFSLDGTLFANSSVQATPATYADPIVWTAGSVTFTATATSHELHIQSEWISGVPSAYMGIDGLHVTQVPNAGAVALMGIAGIGSVRCRRR